METAETKAGRNFGEAQVEPAPFSGKFDSQLRLTQPAFSSEIDHFVFLEQRQSALGESTVIGNGDGLVGSDGVAGGEVALDADLNVCHRHGIEVGRVRVAGEIDEVHQMPVLLAHERDLDQGMRIGLQLTSVRKQSIDQVAQQSEMSLRAVPVVETSNVPWQPRDLSFAHLLYHQARIVGIGPVDANQLRRPIQRRRNKGDRGIGGLHLQIVAIHEDDVGVFHGREQDLVADVKVSSVGGLPELNRRRDLELGSSRTGDDQTASFLHKILQLSRSLTWTDDEVCFPLAQPVEAIHGGKRDVLLGEQTEEAAICALR